MSSIDPVPNLYALAAALAAEPPLRIGLIGHFGNNLFISDFAVFADDEDHTSTQTGKRAIRQENTVGVSKLFVAKIRADFDVVHTSSATPTSGGKGRSMETVITSTPSVWPLRR